MLVVASAMKGYTIEALDGHLGSVSNFLFDDTTWKIRWLVADTGSWLSTRLILLHPSVLGVPDHGAKSIPVTLSKAQIEKSPEIAQDRPVTMQMQNDLYSYYDWDPYWGPTQFGPGIADMGLYGGFAPSASQAERLRAETGETYQFGTDDGDPHLRSMHDVKGYHIHATDGGIGHLENFLIDDVDWATRYLIVDTSNWWIGRHVLISPYAVHDVSWTDQRLNLDVTRERVKGSPTWDPAAIISQMYQRELHGYYGWPGYGW